MKKLKLEQGSQEWLDTRMGHFCASEAAAMMGESLYMSRSELLDQKSGKVRDDSDKSYIFQKGHEAEEKARDIWEASEFEFYPPVVVTRVVEGLPLLASLDGLQGGVEGGTVWEHKLLSKKLAESIPDSIDMHYIWQLEHQMLVAGSSKAVFMASNGSRAGMVAATIESDPNRRRRLIEGWKQFNEDLAAHSWQADKKAPEVAEAVLVELPAIRVDVAGSEITTNLRGCITQMEAIAKREAGKQLVTDQDFADAEQLVKDLDAARKKLKEKVARTEQAFASFAEFRETAEELDKIMQKLHSAKKRQVTEEKEARKELVIKKGLVKIHDEMCDMDEVISPYRFQQITGYVAPDFSQAIKGKRTVDSMEKAVDDMTASELIKIKVRFGEIKENYAALMEEASDYMFLFADAGVMLGEKPANFRGLVKARIGYYEQEQAQKKISAEAEKQAEAAPASEHSDTITPMPEVDAPVTTRADSDRLIIISVMSKFAGISHAQADSLVDAIEAGKIPGIFRA